MRRRPRVHALAAPTPVIAWPPRSTYPFAEDETTEKVPSYLAVVARSFADEAELDTQPASVPVPMPSGIVPAGTDVYSDDSEVTPPSGLPFLDVRTARMIASEVSASLDAFPHDSLPAPSPAANTQTVEQEAPGGLRRDASRTVGSAILALAALFVLFAMAQRRDDGPSRPARSVDVIAAHARAWDHCAVRAKSPAMTSTTRRLPPVVSSPQLRSPLRAPTIGSRRIIRVAPF